MGISYGFLIAQLKFTGTDSRVALSGTKIGNCKFALCCQVALNQYCLVLNNQNPTCGNALRPESVLEGGGRWVTAGPQTPIPYFVPLALGRVTLSLGVTLLIRFDSGQMLSSWAVYR